MGAVQASEDKKAEKLFKDYWKQTLTENPELATYVGVPGYDDKWTDYSISGIEARKSTKKKFLNAAKRINSKKLSPSLQISLAIFIYDLEFRIRGFEFPAEYLAVDQMDGVQRAFPETLEINPLVTKADAKNFLARLEKIPVVIDQVTELLKFGIKTKVVFPKSVIPLSIAQIKDQLPPEDRKSPLLSPLEKMPADWDDFYKKEIWTKAEKIYIDKIKPRYSQWVEFLEKDYTSAGREKIGHNTLPNGTAWYNYLVQAHTTTPLRPEQIHQIGLKEIAQLREKIQSVMAKVNFKKSFSEFCKLLQKDERFYPKTKDEMLMMYRDAAKRADAELPTLFRTLPRLPYGVSAVPEFAEKSSPSAYYRPGSLEAGRAGVFFANGHNLRSHPKYGAETLLAHEAAPGHHFQIAIAQELPKIPDFQKHLFFTAYTEGWGLYAETLGFQFGFYKDPYSEYGHLESMMFRAVRLVADTGIHAMGWTREQAIDLFVQNTCMDRKEVEVEVDRYIVIPGQALSYKIGKLKFLELRDKAKEALGPKFDIRDFHDEMLKHGALPLGILEAQVLKWIKSKKK